MREADLRYESLHARADSAVSGVQSIGRQQKAQGVVISGDILLARDRMQRFLSEARRALSERDLPTAREYMNRADTEIARLEKLLLR